MVCGHGDARLGSDLPADAQTQARASGFAEAKGCSLYGKPSLEVALSEMTARPVFLVPSLMATGGTFAALRARIAASPEAGGIVLCPPLGLHPDLPGRIAETGREEAERQGWAAACTALLLVGHGSRNDPASRDSLRHIKAAVEGAGVFGEVLTGFLSEDPYVPAALAAAKSARIVAVGCFAASGRHAARDVPELLAEADRPIAYCGPIGEAPWIARLILDQARRGAEDRLPAC